jgi:hypothetical protein
METNAAIVDRDEGFLNCVITEGVEGWFAASPYS